MNNARAMGFFQSIANFNAAIERLLQWERPFLQTCLERLPWDIFDDGVGGAALITYIVERANVRMIQR